MRRVGLGVALALVTSGVAYAGEALVTWVNPTKNTDGSSIPASGAGSLVSTKIEWGSCSGTAFGAKAGEVNVPQPALSYTVQNLGPAAWCFRLYAKNTYGTESGPSNVGTKTIQAPTPQPPLLTAPVGAVAYELQMLGNGTVKLGRSVGTLAVESLCGAEFVAGFNAVPGEAVDYYRTPKSSIVVAECEAG